jgi:hypothetical protein
MQVVLCRLCYAGCVVQVVICMRASQLYASLERHLCALSGGLAGLPCPAVTLGHNSTQAWGRKVIG